MRLGRRRGGRHLHLKQPEPEGERALKEVRGGIAGYAEKRVMIDGTQPLMKLLDLLQVPRSRGL